MRAVGSRLVRFSSESAPAASPTGPAHAFLRGNPNTELHLSAVGFGEFAEGFADPDDLWIAATSVHAGLPLVTADAFANVRGLEVLTYR